MLRRLALVACLMLPGAALADDEPYGPSFDCAKAQTSGEKTVCDAPGLGWYDRQLAKAYAITGEATYLEAALRKARLGVIPGQLTDGPRAGRWIDPHNARPAYHYIMMRSLAQLLAVMPEDPVDRADILNALKKLGRQHILVEDTDPITGQPRVRGLFSATHIGRLLGVPVLGFDLPRTFAEIEAALAN